MADESLDLRREFKASFFASLFNHRERGLELVNAFTDKNYPSDTDVTIEILKDVFFMGIQNDLALLVGNTILFLGEHQSSINKSITVRFVSYYGRILESLVTRKQTYKKGTLKLARPVFIVLYNGIDTYPAKSYLNLSKSFDKVETQLEKDSFIELQVLVMNIHASENADLVKKSQYLYGYVEVVRRSREYQAKGQTPEEAVRHAIEDCVNAEIIAEYLRQHASEVIGMLTGQFVLEEVFDEIRSETLDEGIEIGKKESVLSMLRKGYDFEVVADALTVPIEKVREWSRK
ncbi:MAG: Rpn family recombination-promoting nuclease/putative transposase [Peptococcaceae bacterium]|nr:Rpn family recombination-promoting nuclease/putative transposase [Peptococcaceae bacterium]